MLGTLAAIQLTYSVFSPEMFITFNMLTFLVGLHTALSYAVQVDIWETGYVASGKLASSIMIAAGIVLVASVVLQSTPLFFFAGFSYLVYRFCDRLSFNALLTQGMVVQAYIVSIAAIVVEICVMWLLAAYTSENFSRLLAPGLIAGAIPLVAFILVTRNPSRLPSTKGGHGLAFAAHSLAILFVVMIDRIAPSLNPGLGYLDARYLLLFSYSGAVYSLGIAILEPLRPRFFHIAKETSSFYSFLAATNARNLALPIGGVALGTILITVVSSAANEFADPVSFKQTMRDILIGGGLLSFFAMFLLLAYFQMYFLSRREFGPIFFSWTAALAVRLTALSLPRLDLYLAASVLAPISAIAVLFVFGSKKSVNHT